MTEYLLAFLVSLGYGLVSSVIPIFNSEAYLAAAQLSRIAGSLATGLGVGLGQAIGKVGLFLAVRRGVSWGLVKRLTTPKTAKAERPARWRWLASVRRASARLIDLPNHDRYAAPILGLSALTGFPPMFPMPVILAPSRMRTWIFCVIAPIGLTIRFTLMALAFGGVLSLF